MLHPFLPEGLGPQTPGERELRHALGSQTVLQAKCTRVGEDGFVLALGDGLEGCIPWDEIGDGRPGKSLCFQTVSFAPGGRVLCSRRKAQEEARSFFFSALLPGDILQVRVRTAGKAGCFCDVGCGIPALLPISRCCISRLESAAQLHRPGEVICAALWKIDDARGRILLTGRETLGAWEEEAALFRQGQTVTGVARSVQPYGVFVELTPNLCGLAEPFPGVQPGQPVRVFIRAIVREKHKIKLNLLEVLPGSPPLPAKRYAVTSGHLRKWEHYPGSRTVTVF